MSTKFGIRVNGDIVEVANRYYGEKERGAVVEWKDPSYEHLPNNLKVLAINNTPQGVDTVGDLKELAKRDSVVAELKEIKTLVSHIIETLKSDHGDIDDAVNWSQLYCQAVRSCVNDSGREYVSVVVEGASPNSWELCQEIRDRIISATENEDIFVELEW